MKACGGSEEYIYYSVVCCRDKVFREQRTRALDNDRVWYKYEKCA